MKNKLVCIILCFSLVLSCFGCGEEELGNTYVFGSDFQYMFMNEQAQAKTQAKGEQGIYFLFGNFIYYLEDGTNLPIPLCNKVDCMHNKETLQKKREECNAYVCDRVFASTNSYSIEYQDGYIYFVEEYEDELWGGQRLCRVSEDGSQKEKVYEWDNPVVIEWCLHRGSFYYVELSYEEDIEKNNMLSVKKIQVNDWFNKEPQTIYVTEEGVNVYSIAYLMAYGDYLYYTVVGDTIVDENLVNENNVWQYAYHSCNVYNTKTEETKKLEVLSDNEFDIVTNIVFWNDKLLLYVFDASDVSDDKKDIYISNLDGTNSELIYYDVDEFIQYTSDGEYLYCSNAKKLYAYEEELPVQIQIYDKQLNVIDEFKLPFIYYGHMGYYDNLYITLFHTGENIYTLEKFDKSQIGNINGEEIILDTIMKWENE